MASETTEAAGATEHYVGMPQLNFEWFPNQIFWLVVTLVIVYLVLSRLALPRIGNVLSERQSTITRDLEQAEELKQKAAEADEAYNAALAEARAEAQRIIGEAKAEIQIELDEALAKADAEIAAKAAESEKAISEIRASALQSIADVAKDTAAEIVKAVAPNASDDKAIDGAVSGQMKG